MELKDVSTQRYDIGRCAIFHTTPPWDGSDDLFGPTALGAVTSHIGNTEGAVDIAPNSEYSELTLPETSGPAAIKRYLTGDKPQFEIGVFPNPDNIAIFSPTGKGSAGQQRRRPVKEHTLWIVPEELFLQEDNLGNMVEVEVTYAGGAFLKNGQPLTIAEQELVDMSMLVWRADFSRATPIFKHEDGGKSLKQITVMIQQDFTKPDGCQLYLMVGEASDYGISFMGS